MTAAIDIAGQKYGRLTPLEIVERGDRRHWLCRCDCGAEVTVMQVSLRTGNTSSCGCLRREATAEQNKKLKKTHGQTNSREYRSWKAMKNRCMRPADQAFRRYGGRGITVCERWMTFEHFVADMGARPEGTTLDRINPDGNYEPGNCRWATWSVQNTNKRKKK